MSPLGHFIMSLYIDYQKVFSVGKRKINIPDPTRWPKSWALWIKNTCKQKKTANVPNVFITLTTQKENLLQVKRHNPAAQHNKYDNTKRLQMWYLVELWYKVTLSVLQHIFMCFCLLKWWRCALLIWLLAHAPSKRSTEFTALHSSFFFIWTEIIPVEDLRSMFMFMFTCDVI